MNGGFSAELGFPQVVARAIQVGANELRNLVVLHSLLARVAQKILRTRAYDRIHQNLRASGNEKECQRLDQAWRSTFHAALELIAFLFAHQRERWKLVV